MITPEELQAFLDTLDHLENVLKTNKLVYINSNGTLEELNLEKITI